MKNTISNIAKELERFAAVSVFPGLRNSGLVGICLFFFFYARFKNRKKYMEIANNLLENVLSKASVYINYHYASVFADLGRTICFLASEDFFEIEDFEYEVYFEEPLMQFLEKDLGYNLGFSTGITGICDLLLNKEKRHAALNITLNHIYSGLGVEGYKKHNMESLFLFPSEILRDVKIFFLKLKKMNILLPQEELLEKAIKNLESKKILYSNCREYYILQDLREAEIMNNQLKIQSLLNDIANNSSDLVFRGLASMSLADNSLPIWWKLV